MRTLTAPATAAPATSTTSTTTAGAHAPSLPMRAMRGMQSASKAVLSAPLVGAAAAAAGVDFCAWRARELVAELLLAVGGSSVGTGACTQP